MLLCSIFIYPTAVGRKCEINLIVRCWSTLNQDDVFAQWSQSSLIHSIAPRRRSDRSVTTTSTTKWSRQIFMSSETGCHQCVGFVDVKWCLAAVPRVSTVTNRRTLTTCYRRLTVVYRRALTVTKLLVAIRVRHADPLCRKSACNEYLLPALWLVASVAEVECYVVVIGRAMTTTRRKLSGSRWIALVEYCTEKGYWLNGTLYVRLLHPWRLSILFE